MLTLINSNPMRPPIAPIGLEYVGEAAIEEGEEVEVLDLCLAADPRRAMTEYFADRTPELIAVSFRNVDDCFLAGNQWFVDDLKELVREVRRLTDTLIVLRVLCVSPSVIRPPQTPSLARPAIRVGPPQFSSTCPTDR